MADAVTQAKWDKLAPRFDTMASKGAEKRWGPFKSALFSEMEGKVLFLALGTGLDIPHFPKGLNITALDISPVMIEHAQERIADYDGTIETHVMDVHDMPFPDDSFDMVVTSCTFCSVPRPIEGLKALHRVLKPGGRLLMFTVTSIWLTLPASSMALMMKQGLIDPFNPGMVTLVGLGASRVPSSSRSQPTVTG